LRAHTAVTDVAVSHADRCDSLLDACRAYKATVTPPAPRAGGVLGGVLGGLGALAALAGEGGRDVSPAQPALDTPEARLALALDRVGDESDADVPPGHEGLAAPLAAALGAPLLVPLADGLRAVGARRLEHASRLQTSLVEPLSEFVSQCLQGVEAARQTYARRCRDADVARDSFLRLADPRARAAASEAHADAAMARDAARAALAAAVCHAEGARRHAVLTAAVGALQSLREHALAVVADLDALAPAMESAQAFAAQAAAQAEKRAAAQSLTIQAFMAARQAESEAMKEADAQNANASARVRAPAPNEGRSSADAALRQSMASAAAVAASAASGGGPAPLPPPLKESWLMMRAAGGWHRRFFVLDAGGTLAFHRSRAGALAAARGQVTTTARAHDLRRTSSTTAPSAAQSASNGDDDGAAADLAVRGADEEDDSDDDDAAALAKAVGSMWTMGSSLFRGAVSNAVSGARSLAETAGELATAAGQRVTAPSSGSLMLLTASVKLGPPESDSALASLPFVFRVLSPQPGGPLILQAESAAERAAWVASLQGVVAELLTGSGRRGSAPAWAALRAAPGNGACADCGAADPDWASLNLCVLLCQQCAGAHRRLGAAASAVRSLTLDEDAWAPAVCALFAAHGNAAANAVFAALPVGPDGEEVALQPDSPMEARLEAVRAKYVDRVLVDPAAAADACSPGALAAAAAAGDIARTLRLLAAGADANGDDSTARAPLAAAAAAGSLLVAQALLLNGADACAADADGATPAELAARAPGPDADALHTILLSAATRRTQGRSLAGGVAPSSSSAAAAAAVGPVMTSAVAAAATVAVVALPAEAEAVVVSSAKAKEAAASPATAEVDVPAIPSVSVEAAAPAATQHDANEPEPQAAAALEKPLTTPEKSRSPGATDVSADPIPVAAPTPAPTTHAAAAQVTPAPAATAANDEDDGWLDDAEGVPTVTPGGTKVEDDDEWTM
jgi:hypothetical protein